ncbi:hypothetical protein BCF33_2542 [Hasllibacter halocynthiae]|uniref:Heat induced stress protein YflT n=1 Tax=Hasllibacter halocynthiae TaxID=595589 RepID=A0A2T0X3Z4_9RHOB|nr:hypothetical protein [Hasllibacter halocynthiae]PRY93661.1 hypothetical protein BCF33_2542 [Hasllibacter halocynthiae]
MTKAVTAIYRTHATADLVRKELQDAGVGVSDIHIVPDDPAPLAEGTTRSDDDGWNEGLHRLHVPEEDMRTYQNAVRKGDYVVSVDLDGDEGAARVKEIMRRPEGEAYDIDAMDKLYAGTEYKPMTGADAYAADDRYLGTRDPALEGEDNYVRTYSRPNRYSWDDDASAADPDRRTV